MLSENLEDERHVKAFCPHNDFDAKNNNGRHVGFDLNHEQERRDGSDANNDHD